MRSLCNSGMHCVNSSSWRGGVAGSFDTEDEMDLLYQPCWYMSKWFIGGVIVGRGGRSTQTETDWNSTFCTTNLTCCSRTKPGVPRWNASDKLPPLWYGNVDHYRLSSVEHHLWTILFRKSLVFLFTCATSPCSFHSLETGRGLNPLCSHPLKWSVHMKCA